MYNAKKKYVSPEVNVISVDKDVITISDGGLDDPNLPGGGLETPETPWGK